MRFQVAVCGPGSCTEQERLHAHRVGGLLAERGAIVLCGGGGGVMAAAAEGARSRGGLVVGIRPDLDRAAAPDALSAVVFTGMGEARNAAIVASADAVISVGGSWGTLSEIALAGRRGEIPVVCLTGWRVTDQTGNPVPGPVHAATPEEAVSMVLTGRFV
ncbi:TIGR00725 family protein [Streptomyces sp. HNM0663]|uniref:TIGR00725 family protein n=1 Tax=Streptomyces chengmaiensis TaxID=3040919 RepID=A0ABT6HRC4_9ACTN|nr:TIGR00725 family protein [Streptomyces chengmaiensis]MDH2391160.1 TIGR00725 family protein [Streptomyces chengmaiensis]